jgi:hypothetical protein
VLVAVAQLGLAPALVVASTAASRWCGLRVGGLVSAFPAVVGPVLLLEAEEHGNAFAAQSATGTLLGLVALSGFALVYARTAQRAGWRASLAAGWATVAAITLLLAPVRAGAVTSFAAAGVALVVALRGLPEVGTPLAPPAVPRWDLPVRAVVTLALVIGLAAAAGRVGASVGGLLAALPALASILVVFTHRQEGPAALVALLRGMLAGMAGFAVFCLVVALILERAGIAATFVVAALATLVVQGAIAGLTGAGAGVERRWYAR